MKFFVTLHKIPKSMAKVIIYIVLALQILLVALPFVFMHIGYSKEVTQSGLHWTVILISPTII